MQFVPNSLGFVLFPLFSLSFFFVCVPAGYAKLLLPRGSFDNLNWVSGNSAFLWNILVSTIVWCVLSVPLQPEGLVFESLTSSLCLSCVNCQPNT